MLKHLALGSTLALAAAAGAEPLTYTIQPSNSLLRLEVVGDAAVTYTPLLGEPTTVELVNGTSNLVGRPSGSAVADVGLPLQFAGGANGLVLTSFSASTDFTEAAFLFTDIFGQLPIPDLGLPVPLSGAGLVLDIADLVLSTNGPLESPLDPDSEPNSYSWSGEAPLTLSGSLNLLVLIPTQEPIGLPEPVTFSVSVSPAFLFGGFSGEAKSTTLEVGVDEFDAEPEAAASLGIGLGALGGLTVDLTRLRLRVDGAYLGVNKKYGITGGAGAPPGCGMGPELALLVPAVAALRRRRRLREPG